MFEDVITFVRQVYRTDKFIPLHEPRFVGNEKRYVNECIDSTFVSSVGKFVDQFEQEMAEYTGAGFAVATVNGTAALHVCLLLAGVGRDDEVLTQPLTFIATCNAISYCNARPVFVDVDRDDMGMSPQALRTFLETHCEVSGSRCINRSTGRVIRACVPMHTFGHPCKIDEIRALCDTYHIVLVEDAAESLGSFHQGRHTGTFGRIGAISFNGNKIITSGGGGCIITDDEALAKKAKHMTTTAKIPHAWEYRHDMIGYNYRMPNINAALLVAQLESLDDFLDDKRRLSDAYREFFSNRGITFVEEPAGCRSNYWLQSVLLENHQQRDVFLRETNANGVMTRPIWALMNRLEMFRGCQHSDLGNAEWLEARCVNIPSSVRINVVANDA